MFVFRFVATIALAWSLAGPADAEPAHERFAEIISGQIEAFARDDGAAAFSFASPDIQRLFGSPERFMQMVRTGYRAVYRPRSYSFGEPRFVAGTPIQPVQVIGPDGVGVIALYRMEQLADGSWRIGGVTLHASGERGT